MYVVKKINEKIMKIGIKDKTRKKRGGRKIKTRRKRLNGHASSCATV